MKKLHENVCLVVWLDAASNDAWSDTDSFKSESGIVRCYTVGFLLEDNSREVKLVRSCHSDGTHSEGMFAIPKGMVESITPIKQIKPRTKRRVDVVPPLN